MTTFDVKSEPHDTTRRKDLPDATTGVFKRGQLSLRGSCTVCPTQLTIARKQTASFPAKLFDLHISILIVSTPVAFSSSPDILLYLFFYVQVRSRLANHHTGGRSFHLGDSSPPSWFYFILLGRSFLPVQSSRSTSQW